MLCPSANQKVSRISTRSRLRATFRLLKTQHVYPTPIRRSLICIHTLRRMAAIAKTADAVPDRPARLSALLPCPGTPIPANFDSLPVLTREHIAGKIATGHLLVIHPPLVYRVPQAWLNRHPGGDLAILHYVGRDATNEIEGYHTGRTVAQRMARWVVGKVELGEEGWRDMVPPVQLDMWPLPVPRIHVSAPVDLDKKRESVSPLAPTMLDPSMVDPPSVSEEVLPLTPAYQNHLRQSLRKLHARIQDQGLDTTPRFLSGYAPSLVIYATLAFLSIYLYRRASTTFDYFIAAVALGLFWHQVTFVAHDAGHSGLTGDWLGDRLRGILIANFMGGLSIGWWTDNHNVHHRESAGGSARRVHVIDCAPR